MPVEPGQNLLHYRIVDKLGEGGMGVVWKAVDTTLDREVAIKVLPGAFTDDPERLLRFEREAKVLASLNHPHIAAIHSLHETEGIRFLSLELVDGEDLAQRLMRGPLPVDEAVERALQIALALEIAHEQGVIHRDLKPANVKVTSDGTVKVLDFGLAKALEPRGASGSSPTVLPTVTSAGTVAGVLLGTAAYMSPEQARGLTLDRRSDVWSFGCLLYELLSGKAAFRGETITDVLAAIVHKQPDLSALPPATPTGVRDVLERCLRKDARERLRDMGDVGLLLREAKTAEPAADASPPKRVRSFLWPALAGLLGLLLVASWVTRPAGDETGVTDSTRVVGMSQLTDLPGSQTEPALSPDGKQLLYVAVDGGDSDIFLQRVGGEKPINLTADHDGNDFQPAFSPDGERIVFRSDRQGGGIFVMGATGETPRRVSDKGYDPAWSPDGTKIAYAGEYNDDPYNRSLYVSLWILDLKTEQHTELHPMDAMGPDWSPNGRRIAFWTHFHKVQGQRDIVTIAAGGGEPVMVTDDVHTDWDPVWSPDGRWLYFASDRGGSPDLWRVAIDETTGVVRGEPQPVTTGTERIMQLDIAADGRIALVASREPGEILRYDFDPVAERVIGTPDVLAASSHVFSWVTIGLDGRTMVYSTSAPLEQLYWMDIDSGDRRRLLSDEHRNRGPRLSPDGRWVAFYSNRSGSYEIWALRSDGTGLRQLSESGLDVSTPVWLPDGRLIVSAFETDDYRLVRLTPGDEGLDGVKAPLNLESVENSEGTWPSDLSPNGRRLTVGIYDGHGGSTPGIYDLRSAKLLRHDAPDGQPIEVGWQTAWLDDERYVFWDLERRQLLVVDADTGETRVLEGVEGPVDVDFAHQGRVMIANRFRAESDMWLLTLAE